MRSVLGELISPDQITINILLSIVFADGRLAVAFILERPHPRNAV